jgi:hypothetical protein
MNAPQNDYLWDPNAQPDAEVERLERVLQPLGAHALNLGHREVPIPQPALRSVVWRRVAATAAIAASALIVLYGVHVHRLNWEDGSPWPIKRVGADGVARAAELRVGERVATNASETATLKAARIGTVTVAPNSIAKLTRTRKGQHRIELEHGRLHAKVWAPPSYFGVTHGDARFTDLGCEFDLSVAEEGSGTLVVASGWVVYRHREEEILVPERYSLTFDSTRAQTPVRTGATAEFRRAVTELDAQARLGATVDRPDLAALAQAIATDAHDDDLFTLLNLLVRHPHLAKGPLYARLAAALHVEVDESHRVRWAQGDVAVREDWWQRLPAQPKTWWLKWRDAF